LNPGSCYDWHHHDSVDELFVVLKGQGSVESTLDSGKVVTHSYTAGDCFYSSQNTPHRICAMGDTASQFYFVCFAGKNFTD